MTESTDEFKEVTEVKVTSALSVMTRLVGCGIGATIWGVWAYLSIMQKTLINMKYEYMIASAVAVLGAEAVASYWPIAKVKKPI